MLRVVNFAAKMVDGLRKYDHATESRIILKWFDPQTELKYRTQLLAYKLFLDKNPFGNLAISECRRSKRLNDMPKFVLPSIRTDAARRAFDYRAPMLLNEACENLNIDCFSSPISYVKFKSQLKQFYDRLLF